MALHDDLLQQARFLANREPRHPRQASLRRALSTAYYALFRSLVAEASAILAPPQPANLRAQVGRTFAHADMKRVCAGFRQGNLAGLNATTAGLITPPIRQELMLVAQTFVELQEARHEADYDTLASFSRTHVIPKIQEVERSFLGLAAIRGEPNSNVFYAALLLQEKWKQR